LWGFEAADDVFENVGPWLLPVVIVVTKLCRGGFVVD
jgi:hypothetical protein